MKKLSDKKIKKHFCTIKTEFYQKESLQKVIEKSKVAFYKQESENYLSSFEFLYQQGKYIHKRWWLLQAIVLLILWSILTATENNDYLQKSIGAATPLFTILILPELWKNRNSYSIEIECTAYYSLRQLYSARILIFSFIDLLLLFSFTIAIIATKGWLLQDIILPFFLSYIVNCCICFRCFYSQNNYSEIFSIFLCIFWSYLWIQIISNQYLYSTISLPIWYSLFIIAVFYLFFCIYKGQKNYKRLWEVTSIWN